MKSTRFWIVSVAWVVFYFVAWFFLLPVLMEWITGTPAVISTNWKSWLVILMLAIVVTALQRFSLLREARRNGEFADQS